MTKRNPEYEANLLRQYDEWGVYIHPNQIYLGRSYVALNRDGEIDPFTDTSEQEKQELTVILGSLKTALSELYQPDLLNYANLRNTWRHCHWHVIPRYNDTRTSHGHTFIDPNPGKNYAPYPKTILPPDIFAEIRSELTERLNQQ